MENNSCQSYIVEKLYILIIREKLQYSKDLFLHLHKSYKSLRPFIEEGVTFISNLAVKRDEEDTI